MPKKKILIFIDWFLPGYKAGGPISSNANLIEHLQNDYQFYIITRDTDYCEQEPYASIKSNNWNKLPNGSQVYYISNRNLSFSNIIKITKQVQFDTLYINGLYSKYFSFFPLIWFKYFSNKKIIVASRGMLSDHSFSSKKGKKKIFYFLGRTLKLYSNITFHATNQEEADQIRKNLGFKGAIKIAANLPPKSDTQLNKKQKDKNALKLVSIARISEEKNTLFALQLLEKCTEGSIIFDLYGTIYNKAYWNDCVEVIKKLPKNIAVNYKGTIDKAEIPDVLSKYHFLLMPSLGENFGHAIIESLIAGCPVIISDRTPWRNLQKIELHLPNASNKRPTTIPVGWDLPLEQPLLWISILQQCVTMDQNEFDTLSSNAWQYAQSIIKNQDIIEANKNLFL